MGRILLLTVALAAVLCGCEVTIWQAGLKKAAAQCEDHDGIYKLWSTGLHTRVYCRDGSDFLIQ